MLEVCISYYIWEFRTLRNRVTSHIDFLHVLDGSKLGSSIQFGENTLVVIVIGTLFRAVPGEKGHVCVTTQYCLVTHTIHLHTPPHFRNLVDFRNSFQNPFEDIRMHIDKSTLVVYAVLCAFFSSLCEANYQQDPPATALESIVNMEISLFKFARCSISSVSAPRSNCIPSTYLIENQNFIGGRLGWNKSSSHLPKR